MGSENQLRALGRYESTQGRMVWIYVVYKTTVPTISRNDDQVRMAGGNRMVQQLPRIAGSYLPFSLHLYQKGNLAARWEYNTFPVQSAVSSVGPSEAQVKNRPRARRRGRI